YHQKKLKLSIEIVDGLLRENPKNLSAWELKALNMKELGQEKERIPVLRKVLELKAPEERGPIFFELGVLHQKLEKFDIAIRNFQASARLGFNLVPSHLLAGMLAFNQGDMAVAEFHMREVRRRGSTEMEMAGAYYLGLINMKRGNGVLGASYLLEARDLARSNPDLQMSKDLKAPIEQVLEPFSKSQFYANVSILAQYDSNILQLPTSASVQQGSNQATPKTTLLAGFGYLSAPLATFQWVPSYRFNANKNFASGLGSYEYASNTVAMALNWRPLSRLSAGLKSELTHSFKNVDGSYRSYTAASDLGPFLRWTYSEDLQVTLEASLRPLVNFSQSDYGGTGSGFRLMYRRDGTTRYFNPIALLSVDSTGTKNTTYRATATTASLSNLMRLPGDHQLTPAVDYIQTHYALADPVRTDRTWVVRASYARPVSARWTYLGDLSFTANRSNLSGSYSFDRWVVGVGLSYTR
ncbi:MAG: hypothetical protein RJB38_2446, partial [Pseudomonadota bacterium]